MHLLRRRVLVSAVSMETSGFSRDTMGSSSSAISVPGYLSPRKFMERLVEQRQAIEECYEAAADVQRKMLITLLTTKEVSNPNQSILVLPEESFLGIMKIFAETPSPFIKRPELTIAALLDILDNCKYSAAFLEYVLKWLEDRQANSGISGLRIIKILSKLLVCDMERSQETRISKLFWKHAHGVSYNDLVFCLSKVAENYTPNPTVGRQEEFMQTNDERASFLHACSSADIATSFSADVDGALNHTEVYGQKAKFWAEKENNVHSITSSKLVNALPIDFPITARLKTAKECLDRLDLATHISADLNPYESDTLASIISTVMSPELEALNGLKKETELHREVFLQVEKLSGRQLRAYEALKKQQYEILDEFFQAYQKEKEDVVKEALYKMAKCLATVEKASISSDTKLSSEDLLKTIVQKAGAAFKEAEGKLESKSLDKALNSECALCYSEFSKKRKRACLAPCGHASACFDCATKAWEKKPNCPWCKAVIEKPIPVPAKLFF